MATIVLEIKYGYTFLITNADNKKSSGDLKNDSQEDFFTLFGSAQARSNSLHHSRLLPLMAKKRLLPMLCCQPIN